MMILPMPIGGHWLIEPQYGTTVASLWNRPAIYRSAEDLDTTVDIKHFFKSWLLSTNGLLEQQIQTPLSTSIPQRVLPSQSYPDELLDWDDSLMERPARPSGKIKVTLKFAGYAKPAPINETWD